MGRYKNLMSRKYREAKRLLKNLPYISLITNPNNRGRLRQLHSNSPMTTPLNRLLTPTLPRVGSYGYYNNSRQQQ